MNVYGPLTFFLGFAVITSVPAQETNYLRQAYPLCFELFQDEASEEHKACIEVQARRPSAAWTREDTETSVREALDRRKRVEEAERQQKASRDAANEKLSAKRADPSALEFKGIALGLDLVTIEDTGRFSCRASTNPLADRVCGLKYGERETIAGAPVRTLLLYFYSDRLEMISLSFESQYFSSVTDALAQKYGSAVATSEAVQNRMGATFENRKLEWRKGKATVSARRYAADLDTSSVTYQTDFFLQEFARRRKSSTKSNAKDDL
jgi:hypothetical protein